MEYEMVYTQICIVIKTGEVVNKYRGDAVITNKHPDIYKWIKWGKPLPDDIDEGGYKYKKGKLAK